MAACRVTPCLLLVTLFTIGGARAAPSLTTAAPSGAPTGSPTAAPAASTVSLTPNTTVITNRTPVQVTISGVNGPTEAGEAALLFAARHCKPFRTEAT